MDSVTSPWHRSMSIAFPREKRERKAVETAVQGARSSALNACKFLVDSGKLFTAAPSQDGTHFRAVLTDRPSEATRRALCNAIVCTDLYRIASVCIDMHARYGYVHIHRSNRRETSVFRMCDLTNFRDRSLSPRGVDWRWESWRARDANRERTRERERENDRVGRRGRDSDRQG